MDSSQLTPHSYQRNGLEVSLGMVTADHPFLDPRQLEAEATGLLDRMLGVLQDNSRYDLAYDCVVPGKVD